jgi:hypothetical protein
LVVQAAGPKSGHVQRHPQVADLLDRRDYFLAVPECEVDLILSDLDAAQAVVMPGPDLSQA